MSFFTAWFKPPYRTNTLIVIGAVFLSTVDNLTFWHALFAAINKTLSLGWQFKVAVLLCLPALFTLLLSLLSFKHLFKPIMSLLLLLSAVISYFMHNYGVIIDTSMLQNVFETDTKEALELLSWAAVLHVTILGILPVWSLWRCPVTYTTPVKELLSRLGLITLAGLVLGGLIFAHYKELALTMRANRELRLLVNPTYPIYALVKYLKQTYSAPTVVTPLGTDAKQTPHPQGRKTLLVLVVGETARAENFSLNGYARQTNPALSKLDIINYPNTYSCGTATAESVPCMFSALGQTDYTPNKAKQQENLLDILSHAGVQVWWLDNNSGCKGVCERVTTQTFEHATLQPWCSSEECFDEVLLQNLPTQLKQLQRDTVIVLHQKGSHGPAYFKRHPADFSRFTPECTTAQVQDCTQAELTNAYDNTLLYTDHFLAKIIKLLAQNFENLDTALWYMSDHGESLGENGIYLHGLPYFLAPTQQTHIPFILWLSPTLRTALQLDYACLKQHSQMRYSHDELFHSVLSLLRVQTAVYQPAHDVFAECS